MAAFALLSQYTQEQNSLQSAIAQREDELLRTHEQANALREVIANEERSSLEVKEKTHNCRMAWMQLKLAFEAEEKSCALLCQEVARLDVETRIRQAELERLLTEQAERYEADAIKLSSQIDGYRKRMHNAFAQGPRDLVAVKALDVEFE